MKITLTRTDIPQNYRVNGYENIKVEKSFYCHIWMAKELHKPSICPESGKYRSYTLHAEAGSLGGLKAKLAEILKNSSTHEGTE